MLDRQWLNDREDRLDKEQRERRGRLDTPGKRIAAAFLYIAAALIGFGLAGYIWSMIGG